MRWLTGLAALAVAACASSGADRIATYQPPTGSNEVLRGEISSAPGRELVVGDLVLGADAEVPRHYHYGEEFLYVLGGSATLYRPGQPDLEMRAGDGVRIAPGMVHWAVAGPDGVRAVASWVAVEGKPLREAVKAD